MGDAIQRGGKWWQEDAEGWTRWNTETEKWERQDGPPPPPDQKPVAMPTGDKIVWFVGVPLLWLLTAASFQAAYDNPVLPLLTFWGIAALVSWLARRPYTGWAKTFRRVVSILWVLAILGTAGSQLPNA